MAVLQDAEDVLIEQFRGPLGQCDHASRFWNYRLLEPFLTRNEIIAKSGFEPLIIRSTAIP